MTAVGGLPATNKYELYLKSESWSTHDQFINIGIPEVGPLLEVQQVLVEISIKEVTDLICV